MLMIIKIVLLNKNLCQVDALIDFILIILGINNEGEINFQLIKILLVFSIGSECFFQLD